ncbi:DUF3679 domain-containing protein [Bacillus licheniformis]|nr:DUF3679 domain-containing protein [Bacillus licheniformis]
MQQANNGMIEMKGYEDPDLKQRSAYLKGMRKRRQSSAIKSIGGKQKSWNSWKLSTSFPRPAEPWPIRSQTQPVHCMTG